MNISSLSKTYQVRTLTPDDVDQIYALSVTNPLFFEFCPPFVTRESIFEDMQALPPHCTYDDKFYVGFFWNNRLIAVLDLILHYPKPEYAFIGLFMMDGAFQGRGLGSEIVEDVAGYLKKAGFSTIRLAYAKGNLQSEAFWRKNNFRCTGEESPNQGFVAVFMERILKEML